MKTLRGLIGSLAAIALLATGIVAAESPTDAFALSGSDFDPGNIIADELFFDGDAMTEAEIQAFLNQRIGSCSNANCLNVYRQSTQMRTATERCPGGYVGAPNESAARILFKVQSGCNISAKVLLVTLQKEQSLVTSRGPSLSTLERAMGYFCPDDPTRPGWCDPAYGGFFNQVYNAASQFQRYRLTPTSWNHQVRTQQVRYHPNAACGSQTVNIRNAATAGLYNYTPYAPNQAALANLSGLGDSCSAYGNRNFWRFYQTWFGSTQVTPPPPPAPSQSALVTAAADGALWAYPSNNNGRFRARIALPDSARGLALTASVGDVDGDGVQDVAGVRNAREIVLVSGRGAAQFGDVRVVATAPEPVRELLGPGDLTASRAPDLLVVGESGALYLLANSGRAQFAEARVVGSGWNTMRVSIAAGDLTGNGTSDLLAIDRSGRLFLYEGRGGARWFARQQVGNGWQGMRLVATGGDLTGDGRTDLVAVDANGALWLYANLGGARWAQRVQAGTGWQTYSSITVGSLSAASAFVPQPGVGDVSADGLRDMVTMDASGQLSRRAGDDRGGFSGPVPMAAWQPGDRFFSAGDFNRDGRNEILRESGSLLFMHSVDSSGVLDGGTQIGNGWSVMTQIAVPGDVNGDGSIDVIAIDRSGVMWLYPRTADGAFSARLQLGSAFTDRVALIPAGDWRGTGRMDVMSITQDGRLWLHEGNGTGGFAAPRQIGNSWRFTSVFSPGDITSDRVPDLVALSADGTARLYPGNGAGGFRSPVPMGAGYETTVRAQ